jgi:hypothetical protein
MDLGVIGWKEWISIIWFLIGTSGGVFVNTVMNLQVPQKAGKLLTS